ncbi:hypothetical protein LRS37_12805 [Neobacillus sedimentimangrovi]|uniref:Uncharacterized protein n=1 Tax=Neobacillus sedimentimangrovi TaxID=2699460 RepID=A0ABS8QN54_9BACI|nr:hypothetical protein [Neobacillus sedimentimangrovi]MCD4839729.1 hypothetical protein [Neobacillus sedimentimangrovi]
MKKIVSFEADKMRNLKYGINALIELEKALGKPLTDMSSNNFKLEDLRTMLYIGLKWEDKELTPETVGDIMDAAIEKHGMEYLSKKLGEALEGAFGNAAAIPSKK